MVGKKLFSDNELDFKHSEMAISELEVNKIIPQDFKGKDFFIYFYTIKNGGGFNGGAWLYRDRFNKISSSDYNAMNIESFYFIPKEANYKSLKLRSILDVWNLRRKYSIDLNEFAKTHFPFSGNAGDNDYWLDLTTGQIKYIRWESDDNPDNAIIVAPTFYDFCMAIQSKRRAIKS